MFVYLCKHFIHNSNVVWVVCSRSFVFSSLLCQCFQHLNDPSLQSHYNSRKIPLREERKRETPFFSLLQRGPHTLHFSSLLFSSLSSHCIHSFTLAQSCSHSLRHSHLALFNPQSIRFFSVTSFISLSLEKFYSARQLVSKQRTNALLRPTPPSSSAHNDRHHIPFPSSLSLLHSSFSSSRTTSLQPNHK